MMPDLREDSEAEDENTEGLVSHEEDTEDTELVLSRARAHRARWRGNGSEPASTGGTPRCTRRGASEEPARGPAQRQHGAGHAASFQAACENVGTGAGGRYVTGQQSATRARRDNRPVGTQGAATSDSRGTDRQVAHPPPRHRPVVVRGSTDGRRGAEAPKSIKRKRPDEAQQDPAREGSGNRNSARARDRHHGRLLPETERGRRCSGG